jgi:hypothetical protein
MPRRRLDVRACLQVAAKRRRLSMRPLVRLIHERLAPARVDMTHSQQDRLSGYFSAVQN